MTPFTRGLAIALSVPLLLLGAWVIRPVLVPVLIAAQFAIVLTPLNARVAHRLRRRKRLAPTVVTVVTLLGILAPTAVIGVMTVQQLRGVKTSGFAGTVKQLNSTGIHFVQHTFGWLGALGVDMSFTSLHGNVEDGAQTLLSRLGDYASEVVAAAPDLIVAVFLFVIALYFWLRDGHAFAIWMKRNLPFPDLETEQLFDKVRDAARDVMVSQLFTGAVQAGMALAFLFVLKVPGAFLWGILAFALSFIPLFGTTPVTVGATIYLFATGHPTSGVIMAVGVVAIGTADNIVRPLVASSSGNLHPLVTLMGIFGGLATMGASGVFIGPIIAALAVWAFEFYGRTKTHGTD